MKEALLMSLLSLTRHLNSTVQFQQFLRLGESHADFKIKYESTRRHAKCAPNHWPNSELWPQTAGGNQISYTYFFVFISLSRGGTDALACFRYAAKPGVVSKLQQVETTAFLQPATLLPFSCQGRIELSRAGGEGLRSTLGLSWFAVKHRKKPGAKNLLQSRLVSSVPPQSLLPTTVSDKTSDEGWSSKILPWDRTKNRSGHWEDFVLTHQFSPLESSNQCRHRHQTHGGSPRSSKPTVFTQNNVTCIQLTLLSSHPKVRSPTFCLDENALWHKKTTAQTVK